MVRHVAGEPGHIDVHQQAEVGMRQMLVRGKAEEAGKFMRDAEGWVAFECCERLSAPIQCR